MVKRDVTSFSRFSGVGAMPASLEFVMEKDFQCDLDCPAKDEIQRCCKACNLARQEFLGKHPELKEYWSQKTGFWTVNHTGVMLC